VFVADPGPSSQDLQAIAAEILAGAVPEAPPAAAAVSTSTPNVV
jgi:hypothetical protein